MTDRVVVLGGCGGIGSVAVRALVAGDRLGVDPGERLLGELLLLGGGRPVGIVRRSGIGRLVGGIGGLAVVVGEEHGGLSDIWLRHAEEHVRIPMRGQADSLNVAATATILLFEAVRQRDEWRTSNYGKIRTR